MDSLRPVTEEEEEEEELTMDETAYYTTTTLIDADETSALTIQRNRNNDETTVKPNVGDGRDFERWLFTDWLNKPNTKKGGRQKEPALPILKQAKWNSGDNPVLVTAAIMMLGVMLASITERIKT